MIEKYGDMWRHVADAQLVCVTTNGVVRDGRLVMGAGVAAQVVRRQPEIPLLAGAVLLRLPTPYYFEAITVPGLPYDIGLFQTKQDYRAPSDPELIRFAALALKRYIQRRDLSRVHLPFPGIGLGQLRVDDVRPLIATLPDSVTVWRYER